MTDAFFNKHKDVFLKEAADHIERMNASLMQLEKTPNDGRFFQDLFRSVHTLKSIAAVMTYNQIVKLCHAIEDILDAIRNKTISIHHCADALFKSFDLLSASLKEIAKNESEINADDLEQELRQLLSERKENKTPTVSSQKNGPLPAHAKLESIEVKVERLDTLMKLSEELLVSRIKLDLLRETINNPELTATVDTLGRHITDIQYNIMQVRLVSIDFIFDRFPRMVRDLAKQQNKQVNLQLEGGDIELDRSLIDELGETLGHLIRNAIDHGIETTDARMKANKRPEATLVLKATRAKEFVSIEVSDDGAGLDLQKIESVALKQNILTPGAPPDEIKSSIFKGISTTKHVTTVSGRGLGLSIVKQKIESMGGTIEVRSVIGRGTQFFIKIPLTLAVIKVLFIKISDHIYAIPINNIERLLTVPAEDIQGLLNYNAIVYEDGEIPVTHLSHLFAVKSQLMQNYPIVVVRRGKERLGLVVDTLLSTQEVVIKPLTKVVKENKYFSGSALIGSGEMVLILDMDHLFLSRRKKNEWKTANAV